LEDLSQQKWLIGWLATLGVLGSTLIVGFLMWLLVTWIGYNISFLSCLLFGALISPTDPIAVLGLLKTAGVPKSLEINITGESLFNDGVGVVIFMVLFQIQKTGSEVSLTEITSLFLKETGGGILLGLMAGYLAYRMLKSVDNYQVEVLITLALVCGGYALSDFLHISGPIAVVVAGLLIGNHGRLLAMSDTTIRHLDTFWELIDEILNAVLFLLIGLEVLILKLNPIVFLVTAASILIVLAARWISVSLPVFIFRWFRQFPPRVIRILTWGGLRGGISVALALSLPPGQARDLFLPVTYGIVVFSIVVQGLTLPRIVQQETGEVDP
jgi:CPA1 family monovalent cation:H+ antiporter